jgi:surface carbohydrate biosynthesis protein
METDETSRNWDVISLFDIKSRDFFIQILLKALFDRGGKRYKVLYQDPVWNKGKNSFFQTLKWKSDLIITPTYHVRRSSFMLAMKHRCRSKLVVFHSEQLIQKENYWDKLNTSYLREYNRDVDFHFVWGRDFAQKLIRHASVSKDKIFIVGCPKLDLLNMPFSAKEKQRRTKSKRVLFVSDFLIASMSDAEFDWILKRYQFPKMLRHIYQDAQKQFISLIERSASTHPDVDFIVRLHPDENEINYASLKKTDNIHFDRSKTFSLALKGVDLVFQFLSTSFFETLSAGVPVYNIRLTPKIGCIKRDYFKYFNFIDEEDVFSIIKKMNNKTGLVKNQEEAMNELFSRDLGSSIPRIYFAIGYILNHIDRRRNTGIIDRWRIRRSIVFQKLKEWAGKILYFCWEAGIRNGLTNKIIEAQKRFETGPHYYTEEEIEKEADKIWISSRKYLSQTLEKTPRFKQTRYGIEVSAQ